MKMKPTLAYSRERQTKYEKNRKLVKAEQQSISKQHLYDKYL